MALHIRPYAPADRAAVRAICCDTADRGQPVERFFDDREAFADVVTGYYTTYEPQALWVAEQDGCVVGYLTGCLDTGRYRRLMVWRVVPDAVRAALDRGALTSRWSWRLGMAGLRTWWRGSRSSPHLLRVYPAHFHVNLQAAARGQNGGRQLVERFLAQARSAGVSGAYAPVRADNPRACRFFAGLGFVELGRSRVVCPSGDAYEAHDTILYGIRL